MNTKKSAAFVAATALAVLLGCSTPQPVPPVAVALPDPPPPPPEFSFSLPLEQPQTDAVPRFCKLGTSCLAMDPRPFEPCLLSTKYCGDKAVELMQVAPPLSVPAPDVGTMRISTSAPSR